jgi:sugar-phospahte nucleotidyltransferase|nr:MAG TPA: type-1 restriction enzyme [Caudoviricetes sp.]
MKQALINGAKSDEWYTPVEVVRMMLSVYPPKSGDRVLMPFDTDKSNFVKVITQDYDPLAIYGINDFLIKDYEFDYLITNPPYSNKDEVIARCIETGKPCVLILPIDTLGGYKDTNYIDKLI